MGKKDIAAAEKREQSVRLGIALKRQMLIAILKSAIAPPIMCSERLKDNNKMLLNGVAGGCKLADTTVVAEFCQSKRENLRQI